MRVVEFRGRYYAYWREGKQSKRVALRTSDPDVAARRFEDLKRGQARKQDTCAAIVEAYFADRGMSDAQKYAWQALQPHFGHLRPDQVSRQLCRDYAADRRRSNRSDGTIIKELSVLRAALRWADKNTPAVFEMPSTPPPRDVFLTRSEMERLLEASANTPHLQLFIRLALQTGARAQAILDLTWQRIDFDRGLIRLAGIKQTNKRRPTVPINATLDKALRAAREIATCDHVIEYAGGPVKSIKTAFRRAVKDAGLKDVTPHVLRHTAAVWMAEAGVPMQEIADYLGHTDIKTTWRHYAKYSPEYMRRAASALEI